MSKSTKNKLVRAPDYRVLYADNFGFAISDEGVRVQIMQTDPDGFVSVLIGLQIPHSQAQVLSEGLTDSLKAYEKETGAIIPSLKVEVVESK